MTEDLPSLRQAFRSASYFGDRIGAFWLMVDHPDVTWNDLIDGLDAQHHELIRSHARGTLYAAFPGFASSSESPVDDPLAWHERVRDRGLRADAKVRERPPHNQPLERTGG